MRTKMYLMTSGMSFSDRLKFFLGGLISNNIMCHYIWTYEDLKSGGVVIKHVAEVVK